MIKPTLTISILLAGAVGLQAQNNPLSTDVKRFYEGTRNNLMRAAEKMPEADYAFKPVPEVRSFGQLIGHIADAQLSMCAGAKGVVRPDVQVEKTKTTKSDLVAALMASDALCDSVLADLTDAKAVEMVKVFGRERTRLSVLYGNSGHSYEHYGNMVTYMRIKGLVPPTSEPRPAPKK
jgi:uncharacterized damage-inducible protein DinB